MEVHPKKNSVGVRWVREIGDNLYAWDGASHVIHVETLLEINANMFRRSSRRYAGKIKEGFSGKGSRDVFERVLAFIHPAPKVERKGTTFG